jgi:hypothetical protein
MIPASTAQADMRRPPYANRGEHTASSDSRLHTTASSPPHVSGRRKLVPRNPSATTAAQTKSPATRISAAPASPRLQGHIIRPSTSYGPGASSSTTSSSYAPSWDASSRGNLLSAPTRLGLWHDPPLARRRSCESSSPTTCAEPEKLRPSLQRATRDPHHLARYTNARYRHSPSLTSLGSGLHAPVDGNHDPRKLRRPPRVITPLHGAYDVAKVAALEDVPEFRCDIDLRRGSNLSPTSRRARLRQQRSADDAQISHSST